MRRMRKIILAAAAWILPGSPTSAGEPYSIPAHWVADPTAVEPNTSEFMFEDASFSSDGTGWIVGDKFFLHVIGEQIEITFTNRAYIHFHTVTLTTSGEAWAGGFQGESSGDDAIVWRNSSGKWRPVDLSPLPVRARHILKLRFESPQSGWALLADFDPNDPYATPTGSFLHFDGVTWREVVPLFSSSRPRLKDMCVQPTGAGWAVGDARDEAGRWHGVVLKKEGLEWREVALPPLVPDAWQLNRVACFSTGGMLASAEVAGTEQGTTEGILLRYDGSWMTIPFPDTYREYIASALTVVRDDAIWLHASALSNLSILLHRAGEHWSDVPIPPLPGKGPPYRGVTVNAMQFVSPNEGWAVGTKYYGEGYFRGLLFHYKDGAWRTRNWNWHFWNQRWFGLFGE